MVHNSEILENLIKSYCGIVWYSALKWGLTGGGGGGSGSV